MAFTFGVTSTLGRCSTATAVLAAFGGFDCSEAWLEVAICGLSGLLVKAAAASWILTGADGAAIFDAAV